MLQQYAPRGLPSNVENRTVYVPIQGGYSQTRARPCMPNIHLQTMYTKLEVIVIRSVSLNLRYNPCMTYVRDLDYNFIVAIQAGIFVNLPLLEAV